jgi:toxin ParE1/3/4
MSGSRSTWKVRVVADRDIDQIAEHIAADNIDAAIRFVSKVRAAYELLSQFPKAGQRRRGSIPRLGQIRSWPLGGHFANYLILYAERDYGVEILRVVHGAQDVDRLVDELE